MKKRQLKKLQKIAAQMKSKPSIQEAWDIVAEHLVKEDSEYPCFFVTQTFVYPYVTVNDGESNLILQSTLDMNQIKAKLYQEGKL